MEFAFSASMIRISHKIEQLKRLSYIADVRNRFAVALVLLFLQAFGFKFRFRFNLSVFGYFFCKVAKFLLYINARLCNISYGNYYEKKKVDTLPI